MTANDDLIREARHATLALIPADHRRQAGRYLEQIEVAAAQDALARLREPLAEGLHKAMCYGPEVLHNRLACERPNVYLNLADAALRHPAVLAALTRADQ